MHAPAHRERQFGQPPFGLTTAKVDCFWRASLADDDSQIVDPLAIPLGAEFSGLPRTILIAAGLDCLRDDTIRLAERLAQAGVSHSLAIHARLPHSFLQQTAFVAASDRALSEAADEARAFMMEKER